MTNKKTLLVIDVQQYFINQFTKDVPVKILNYINKNKLEFDHILFFKFVNSETSNWVKVSHWPHMLKAPETNIVSKLQPFITSNNVFSKTAFSCFKSKQFSEYIKQNNLHKFYLCGLDTHAYIYCTAMEGYELGFDMKVIQNLCAASHGFEYHNNSLKALAKNLGDQVLISSTSSII